MNSVAECLQALEIGMHIIGVGGSTLWKTPDGLYHYAPPKIVSMIANLAAIPPSGNDLSSPDLFSLFAVILLRDATVEPVEGEREIFVEESKVVAGTLEP